MKINNEQLRVIANLESAYDAWMAVERETPDVRPWLTWRTVSGQDYLYELRNRRGHGASLGPRSTETEAQFSRYEERRQQREAALQRAKSLEAAIHEQGRLYRALRLPLIDSIAGAILREADRRRMLGTSLLVVGTNTMAAYEFEARYRFASGLDSTSDFDMTWAGTGAAAVALAIAPASPIMDLLKEVDELFTVNSEKPWQARNANAYEVDVLLAPSVAASYPAGESLRPTVLREQEWLLQGHRISHVVMDRNGMPARIVAPDPRWMALHKLYIADKPERNPVKKDKDRAQGLAMLEALREHMPQYPMDEAFTASLPSELRRYLTV